MIEESQNFAAEQGKALIKSYHLHAIFCFIFMLLLMTLSQAYQYYHKCSHQEQKLLRWVAQTDWKYKKNL